MDIYIDFNHDSIQNTEKRILNLKLTSTDLIPNLAGMI
jgi:hypothetical protein